MAWQRHLGRSATATRAFESLLARHRSAGRHYHGVRHVRWVVRHVLALAAELDVDDLGDDVDAVVAAAFFHDAVYDVGRDDNEARSAELAVTTLRDLGWSDDRADRVAAMIVATAHHTDPDADNDRDTDRDTGPDADTGAGTDTGTAVLLAADLAVLAAEPAAYADYVRNVRREYAHLDDDQWRSGRGAVIAGLLRRASIFPPGLGLDSWERRARANLTAEAAALR